MGILMPAALAASKMVASLGTDTCLSSIVRFTISTSVLPRVIIWTQRLLYGHQTAGIITGLALGALVLVQERNLPLLPDNGVDRTGLQAGPALHALFFHHLPEQQLLAAI